MTTNLESVVLSVLSPLNKTRVNGRVRKKKCRKLNDGYYETKGVRACLVRGVNV
jgi:hypothetical protein